MKHYTKCLMCGWRSEPGEIAVRCEKCCYSAKNRSGALLSFPVGDDTAPPPLNIKGLDPETDRAVTAVQGLTPTGIEAMVCRGETPAHYQSASGITPWDLQRGMKTSGSPFVDARRCDAIKYAFRVKDDMVADLRKAAHCLTVAADEMERRAKE